MEVLASVHARLLFFCFCYTVYPCSVWFFFTRCRWHSICQCLLMGRFLVRYSRPFLPFFVLLICCCFFFLQSFLWFCFSAVLMLFHCALLSYNIWHNIRSKVTKAKCFTWLAFTIHIFYPFPNFHFSILRSSVTLFTCRYWCKGPCYHPFFVTVMIQDCVSVKTV